MFRLVFGSLLSFTILAAVCLVVGGVVLAVVFLRPGKGSGSDTSPTSTGIPGIATLSGLQAQLASVVLQQSDVPDGLEGSAPAFSTNEDVAGQNVDQLQTLVQSGRQLGVDVQFIPTDRLDPNSPVRGGIQSSASVYTDTVGASQSLQNTVTQARANNWQANYPDLQGLQVTEVRHKFGDESLWLRITGEQCQSAATPVPAVPASTCNAQQLVVLDNVIFRVGRVREFLQISTLFPIVSQTDVYEDQIQLWGETAAQHATATFPSP